MQNTLPRNNVFEMASVIYFCLLLIPKFTRFDKINALCTDIKFCTSAKFPLYHPPSSGCFLYAAICKASTFQSLSCQHYYFLIHFHNMSKIVILSHSIPDYVTASPNAVHKQIHNTGLNDTTLTRVVQWFFKLLRVVKVLDY